MLKIEDGKRRKMRLRAQGALRRGGSLFEKSSAKTFLRGTAVLCVIFGGEALASPPVRENYGKKKASFLLPVFVSDWRRSQSFSAKNDATFSCSPRKVFAELFSKSDPPRRSAPRARRRPPHKKQSRPTSALLFFCEIISHQRTQ